MHSDVQAVQLRLAEEEVHKVKMEVNGKAQINMPAAKYEKAVKSSSVRSEEGGEPKSQAHYMIQAAQKREELQRQGDELDQEIRRREREMRAGSCVKACQRAKHEVSNKLPEGQHEEWRGRGHEAVGRTGEIGRGCLV